MPVRGASEPGGDGMAAPGPQLDGYQSGRSPSCYTGGRNAISLELLMKLRGYIVALLTACSLAPLAVAQPNQSNLSASPIGEQYVPRLGDIMNAVQMRHIKLWFAGKAQNWDLAAYELRQLKAGLFEAAVLYEGIPVSNVTTMTKPIQSISDAIDAKDFKRFTKSVGELTDGCNSCHQTMQRGFIVMQMPTTSPFSDQSFAPAQKKP
jgi:hypothetical protein